MAKKRIKTKNWIFVAKQYTFLMTIIGVMTINLLQRILLSFNNIIYDKHRSPDLEKVIKSLQADNLELYNVLKIAWFVIKLRLDWIFKCWLSTLNLQPPPSPFSLLHSLYSYLRSRLYYLNSPSSTLLSPSSVKNFEYFCKNVLKIAGLSTKCPKVSLALLAAFSRSEWF